MLTSAVIGAAAGRFLKAAPLNTPFTIFPTCALDSYQGRIRQTAVAAKPQTKAMTIHILK